MAIIAVGMEAIAIVAMGITDRIIGRFTIIRLLATAPLVTARPPRSFLGLDSADLPRTAAESGNGRTAS